MTAVALQRSKTYFEQFVASVPEPLQGFTRTVLTPFEQLLEQVAGDPDDLMRGAERCLAASNDVLAIATEQARDRARLQPPAWGGPAQEAFQTGLGNVEESIRQLAQGLAAAKDVLVEAANAAVDAFNLLCELIFEFLTAFLIEALIAAAAAFLSFGASIAAFIVRWLARLAMTLGRGARIVSKLVRILVRLARKLDDVKRLLTAYRQRVMELRKLKKQYSLWKAKGRSAEGMAFRAEYALKVGLPRFAFNKVSPVNLSGKGGAALDTAIGLYDIRDGRKDRNYATDGTYRNDIGPYAKSAQDLLDSLT
ncbi:WXG100 family type VII secretion target [Micromonospora sp. HM5-17]|uniref:WXG100 family type VII secretion target n=1 Tax=Micromonospora sp. HM5-17 TaxID=2487710 RepID=UPI000F45FCE0|nr:WXG100 family type VII secretion target [Micromonospora sp. HM5-17]ROT32505.1 WXG100 family type VII secretion target [Micromonospora sp. HM5-17]